MANKIYIVVKDGEELEKLKTLAVAKKQADAEWVEVYCDGKCVYEGTVSPTEEKTAEAVAEKPTVRCAPQKASTRLIMHPWVHFFILSDECLELPSDSVKKGITLKRFEKQCTVSSERCRGICISRSCGTLPIQKEQGGKSRMEKLVPFYLFPDMVRSQSGRRWLTWEKQCWTVGRLCDTIMQI